MVGEARVVSAFVVSWVLGFMGIAAAGREGARFMGTSVTGGMDHRPCLHCHVFPCGRGHHCGQEAGVVCTVSSDATEFSGVVGLATGAGIPGSQVPPLLSPRFRRLCVIQSTHLQMHRCMEFSGVLTWWAEAALFSCGCRLKRRGKGASHPPCC